MIKVPKGVSSIGVAAAFLLLASAARAGSDVTIYNRTAQAMTQRPVSVAKVFKQGDIPLFAKASIAGLTQCDVKNRWPDGSLQFAVVSFLADIPANGSIQVSFSNQGTGNNTGFLTRDQMLDPAYHFDGGIQTSGDVNSTVGAREMLQGNYFRYWLQGPIVTAVLIEDRADPGLPYDSTKNLGPLHPIFEAWFYPDIKNIDLGYTLENEWASSDMSKSARTVTYSLTLTTGTGQGTAFTHRSYGHIPRTRWHKRFWVNGDPGKIHIKHDPSYLTSTRAVPNFDTSLQIAESLISNVSTRWLNSDHHFDGDPSTSLGSYGWALDDTGAADHIGTMTLWDVLWVMTQDERMADASLGNADLAGYMLFHWRERDDQAGEGKYFDGAGVGTFGRVLSVNARYHLRLSDLSCSDAHKTSADAIQSGALDSGNWRNGYGNYLDNSHMPDVAYVPYLMTGRYYYLEELQMQGDHSLALYQDCSDTNQGLIHAGQMRGKAWSFRTMSYAFFASPDGTPEKNYFDDKIRNNIAYSEKKYGMPLSDSARAAMATTAVQSDINYRGWTGPSPLGLMDETEGGISNPVNPTTVIGDTTQWRENFMTVAFGIARDFGFPTDNMLKFIARNRFNILLNPVVISPALVDAYSFPAIRKDTNDWVQTWSDLNNCYITPLNWTDEGSLSSVDHSYGYIALSAFSYLYPYSIPADPVTGGIAANGAQAWDSLFNATGRANGKLWRRSQVLTTSSPKWSLLPRELTGSQVPPTNVPAPARPRRLRAR